MFEAILGGIVAIGLSVIANFITPFIQDFFGYQPPSTPEIEVELEIPQEPENIEQWRAQNRKKLEKALGTLFFYGFSYFAMYMAFYIPVVFKGGLLDINVNLINSRVGIDYLITSNNLSTICAVFGVLAFFPFWKLSQIIANLVSAIMWHFSFVNELKYLAFTVLAMVFWAFFIAGNISYLLNPEVEWFASIKISLMLWVLLIFSALANEK